jgi:hypothetical protein
MQLVPLQRETIEDRVANNPDCNLVVQADDGRLWGFVTRAVIFVFFPHSVITL